MHFLISKLSGNFFFIDYSMIISYVTILPSAHFIATIINGSSGIANGMFLSLLAMNSAASATVAKP